MRTLGALLVLAMAVAAPVGAQADSAPSASLRHSASLAGDVRFLIASDDSTQPPRAVDPARVPLLHRIIALELHRVSRDAALAEIGRSAGVGVVYASELIPRADSVAFTAPTITVATALQTALSGLPLDVLVDDAGGVVLLARGAATAAVVDGVVVDSIQRQPVSLAAVRIAGTSRTVLTDAAGRFHFDGAAGPIEINVRRIGFHPASQRFVAARGVTRTSVSLTPTALGLDTIVVSADRVSSTRTSDSAARRIMTAVLTRRERDRLGVHDYRYDAHVLQFERDAQRPADSSSSITAVRESVIKGFWEAPGRTQQIVVARREADRLPGGVRVQVGSVEFQRVEPFDDDRWAVFGVPEVAVPSPVGRDALGQYAFAVLDTLWDDGRRVLRLSVAPSSPDARAFDGIIDVADSTFEIVAVDVGMRDLETQAYRIKNLRVRLGFGDVGDGRRMPVAIATKLRTAILGVYGFNPEVDIEYAAMLGGFQFNGPPPRGVGEYGLVVSADADRAGQHAYAAAPRIPLRAPEAEVQTRIDSAGGPPPGWSRPGGFHINANDLADIRFNRVDGWRYGGGGNWDPAWDPGRATTTTRLGYAFGARRWTYDVGERVLLSPENRVSVSGEVHDETRTTLAFASPDYNPTLGAFFAGPGADALSYHRARGFDASASSRVFEFTQFSLSYSSDRESSLAALASYSNGGGGILGLHAPPNPSVVDGRRSAFTARVEYDSRPLLLEPRAYRPLEAAGFLQSPSTFTRVLLEAEAAAPGLFGGDFDYRRYMIRLERRQEDWRFGTTDMTAVAGVATGSLPPQRWFEVNGGAPLPASDSPFATLGDSVYGGNRAVALMLVHGFDQALQRSGIPLVRSLPLGLQVHASSFWSTLSEPLVAARPLAIRGATNAYAEVGVTLGYKISGLPFVFAVRVSRQLSSYPTDRTRMTIGFF